MMKSKLVASLSNKIIASYRVVQIPRNTLSKRLLTLRTTRLWQNILHYGFSRRIALFNMCPQFVRQIHVR